MVKTPFDTAAVLSHVTLGVTNLDRSIAFYDAVLSTLGLARHSRGASFAGYGHHQDAKLGVNSVWILVPTNGLPATAGNGTNVAFLAPSRAAVHAFHDTALACSGRSDGLPGLRPEVHPDFYAAYVLDPDGNKLVAVFHAPT